MIIHLTSQVFSVVDEREYRGEAERCQYETESLCVVELRRMKVSAKAETWYAKK
jgi:hypothetical protein